MKKSFFIFSLIFLANFLFAKNLENPLNQENQRNLFEINSDLEKFDFSLGSLNAQDFLTVAFIASGLNLENSLTYVEKAENLFNQFKNQYLENKNFGENGEISFENQQSNQENQQINQQENAKNALSFLYENLFTKYSELQTLVNVAFDNGTYNCVSSDVIYVYFAKKLGLNVVSVETPEHAFCSIYFDSSDNLAKKIDVETTNPYGFNPGEKQNLSQKNAWVVVPQRKYRNRHEISDARLLSLIYNNRISSLQRRRKNFQAASLAFDAMFVQNYSDESKNLFFHCIENHIADLENLRQRDEAIKFIRQAIVQFGKENILSQNVTAVVNNKVGELLRQNKTQEAAKFLAENEDLISRADFLSLNESITLNFLNDLIDSQDFIVAKQNLEENKQNLSAKNYSNLFTKLYSKEADRISKENLLDAADFLKTSMAENKSENRNATLQNQRNVYLHNFEVLIHNQVATLVNAGNYSEAQKILEDALSQIENSRILLNDLNRLRRIVQ